MNTPEGFNMSFFKTKGYWLGRVKHPNRIPPNVDFRIAGDENGYNPNLYTLANHIINNLSSIDSRVAEYLTHIDEIDVEGNLLDMSGNPQLSNHDAWIISWFELLDIHRCDRYEVVCHSKDDRFVYICWIVMIQADIPISLRGEWW